MHINKTKNDLTSQFYFLGLSWSILPMSFSPPWKSKISGQLNLRVAMTG